MYSIQREGSGQVERWGAWVETQKNVRGEIGGWGRVPFALRPVVKYHLRRGVGLINFFENGTRPQPPTLGYVYNEIYTHSVKIIRLLSPHHTQSIHRLCMYTMFTVYDVGKGVLCLHCV